MTNATPEPPCSSVASKWTVASVWFQPSAFAAGLTECVTTGLRLSHLIETLLPPSTLPALSTA